MSFETCLSGLNNASKSLDVTGNNIANASTIGFKASQANFADVYAASVAGASARQSAGLGAATMSVVQSFTQGSVTSTGRPLDMAIRGQGFFRMSTGGTTPTVTYTRNGQFHLVGELDVAGGTHTAAELASQNALVVNDAGLHVTGYAANYSADPRGVIDTSTLGDIVIPPNMPASATSRVAINLNLDAGTPSPGAMDPARLTASVVAPLAITAANNSLAIQLDGLPATPVTVDIPIDTYANADALATAVQTAINTHPTIVAQNTLVDVAASGGSLSITARSAGSLSTINVSAVTGDNGFADLIGGVSPAAATGVDNFDPNDNSTFTASTGQTVYDAAGNRHNLTMYFAKTAQANTWQMYTTLNNGFASGSVDLATLSYPVAGSPFTVSVDGSAAVTATISGIYANATSLRSAIQNAVDAAVGPGKAMVSLDASNQIVVTSETLGTNSNVTLGGGATFLGTPTSVPGIQTAPTTLTFDTDGALVTSPVMNLAYGTTLPTLAIDLAGSTQFGLSFGVNSALQDGFAAGNLSGLSVSSDGIVQASYSNAQSRNAAQVVLASFVTPGGLTSIGNNQWEESAQSGAPSLDTPDNNASGSKGMGSITGGAVEQANLDLGAELVNLIVQQRYYQANAQAVKAQDQILQSLAGIR